ncbi:5-dehydro-4-deoxyglucarate dehydratase [Ureibacillus aquaedulcis]|uniref:5-dehydro-4-deoxyglucarate dehydratase n=1 Tax=Ureibacillus aquaedulcis TaxID=3058421 RepID=A0ABT8GQ02_9BACL|nr:5-dehydro-4-deoxyglucarate dehydratase [Ureibacillus sp. BA0131]MDN4493493.1 5-dehydro-4-deoxyglucarate dehydratase [Ureibacillus sp. BA0131]
MTVERPIPTGILGFPVTPMNEDLSINYEGFQKNIEFLIENGLNSIFIACGAGEFHAISEEEYEQLIIKAKEVVQNRVPIYTGVGGKITEALRQTKISAKHGVEGYLILPPYLIDPSQDGIFAYLKMIIKSTDLNAIVYQRDNCILTLDTLKKLAELPQLVGFKDGVGNIETNVEFTQALGNRLAWINGMPLAEVTMPTYLNIGFDTYSSAISNYIPFVSRQYLNALISGNHEKVKQIYEDVIFPIHNIRKQKKGYAVSLIKAGMNIVGLSVDTHVRPPIAPVEQQHYEALAKIIERAIEKYAEVPGGNVSSN